jgi:hypothetical protein
MAATCKKRKTLEDILEKDVDPKYFASPEIVSKRKPNASFGILPCCLARKQGRKYIFLSV